MRRERSGGAVATVTAICPVCGGSGSVAVDRMVVELASERGGTGLVSETCRACTGEGKLTGGGTLA
ncbi:hypothetical protein GCM10027569_57850 [Flindersiella endophytica]